MSDNWLYSLVLFSIMVVDGIFISAYPGPLSVILFVCCGIGAVYYAWKDGHI